MEVSQAFAWVDATMRADSALVAAATGGIWQGFADIGVTAPYAQYSEQAGTDTITINAKRLFSRLLLQIKAIGPTGPTTSGYAALVVIANRIDALFGRVGSITLSPGVMLSCYREQPLSYEELINGAQWSHLGGLYHIDLQGS